MPSPPAPFTMVGAPVRLHGRNVGLLGGSFNPAHEGHLAISREALARLGLDAVWWLVSPQNPLKSEQGMAPFEARWRSAHAMAQDPRILVSDFESRAGTRYTLETLRRLILRFPDLNFVWLMGADNLVQFDRWRGWREILATVPIAVFDRPGYTYRALASRAAHGFRRQRCLQPRLLLQRPPPAWCFLFNHRHAISATAIRMGLTNR